MPTTVKPLHRRHLALFLLAALVTTLCYAPGLWGPFLFDDEPNITRNSAVQASSLSLDKLVVAATSYGDGTFKRPLSMVSFALNHLATGLDPFWFKLTNLLIHLANGLLVFLLARLWLRALHPPESMPGTHPWLQWVPLAVSAAWMLHPLNLTSVLYVVQRMTSLGALFVLGGMLLYIAGRLRLRAGQPGGLLLVYLGVFGGTLLAYWSKENGILLPLYLLVTESILFRFSDPRPGVRWTLRLTFLLVVGLPFVAAIGFLALHPQWLPAGYEGRSFSLLERVLTQPRVIVFYLRLLLVPSGQVLSLYHDDIEVSTGWSQPWTTVPAILALGTLLVLAIGLHKRLPVFAFGVLFFLVGHSLESTVIPLEMVHEHRNYLPIVGILFAASYYLFKWPRTLGPIPLGAGLVLIFTLLFAWVTLARSELWSNLYTLTATNTERHPTSARWQHELGRAFWIASTVTEDPVMGSELADQARKHFLAAAQWSEQPAGSLLAILHLDSALGVAPKEEDLARLQEILSGRQVNSFAVNSFLILLDCLVRGSCEASPETVEVLLLALLENHSLGGVARGKLLASAIQWTLVVRKRPDTALVYARQAVSADPRDIQHHLNLIGVLIQAGALGEARERLDSTMDRGDAYLHSDRISALHKSMGRAEPSAESGAPR